MVVTGFHSSRAGTVLVGAVLFFGVCVWLSAGAEPVVQQQAFVLSLMLCTLGVVACALARPATALVITGGLFLGLKFISVLKLRYLDSALMPSDFVYFAGTSLVDTLRHYPHLYALGIGLCVGVPLLLWLVWRGDVRWLRGRRWWLALLLRGGGAAVFALAFWGCLLPQGVFAQIHARNAWEKMSDDAQLTNFFVNISDADVHLPAMSDADNAQQQWGATAHAQPWPTHKPYPDIVQVLEESTFDPSSFSVCTVPQCRVRMFHVDASTRGHGVLRVHTFGGGTWVSEFAALTGMPHDIFGPGGMYAPYVLAPHMRDALAQQLRRLGYTTIAVYPTAGSFINGRNAYNAYGFDHLYDASELHLDEWEETDAQMFAAAKRAYDMAKKPGQPVFVMILTLNQHGPHDEDPRAKLPAPYNRGVLRGLSKSAALNFDTYLARLQASDAAMRGLEHMFLDRAQPTVLLHFGDHQPSFGGLIRDMPRTLAPALRPYRDYLTYYMLKSNFAGPPLPAYPMLDIAFLPTLVLQAADLPVDPYFSAETALRDRCNGLYIDCTVPGMLESYHAWVIGHLHVYE
ncbi:MAG: sulfatase-like hydrolase/transferase [Rhodanobacter sp.]